LASGFAAQGWTSKPKEQFERYFSEQTAGGRACLVAELWGEPVGYVNLLPEPFDGPFLGKGIPEISDFNVLEAYQGRGIGGKLMDAVEALAARTSGSVVLGVGLHPGYGAAQRMYAKRGYVPDGTGLWWNGRQVSPGESVRVDDDLVLVLRKELKG
jgi:GNAT superfamily N-acetyltransferase